MCGNDTSRMGMEFDEVFFLGWIEKSRVLEEFTSGLDLAALPGNRFEALKGKRKGQYSIRINDQWRVCFEWPEKSPGPTNVEIVDYH